MNIANMLTIFRLILIPVYIFIFFSDITNSFLYSVTIFLLAGFTDILDGYLARKYKLVTKVGIALDPLADKLMLITVLASLVIKFYSPIWILVIVTSKEIFMICCGILLYKSGTVIPSNRFGKVSTILFYISILVLAFNDSIGLLLLYISVGATLIALVNYFIVYTKNKKTKEF